MTVAEKMAFPWNFLPGFNMHGGCGEIYFSKYKVQVHLMELLKYCESKVKVTVYMLPIHVLATWNLRNLKILRED